MFLKELRFAVPLTNVVEIHLRDMNISPCRECYGCEKTGGECVIKDDMHSIYSHILESDVVILAAPIFFYNFNALAKAMIDRIQALWVRKYLLKDPVPGKRAGILISAGGTKGEKLFDGAILTYKYFLDSVNGKLLDALTFKGLDGPEDIKAIEEDVVSRMRKAVELLKSKE